MNLKLPREEVTERVEQALAYMNIESLKDRAPHYLSGGEKKRVTIADILAMKPEIIIFDEPTASLDPVNAAILEEVLEKLEKEGVRLVDFRKIGKKEGEYLENYFDSEIAPLISPTVVGKRQPFPFLKNKDIYAVVVLEGKMVRKSLALFLVVPMYSQD